MLRKRSIKATPLYPNTQCQATRHGSAETCLSTTQPLRTDVGRFQLSMQNWGLASTLIYDWAQKIKGDSGMPITSTYSRLNQYQAIFTVDYKTKECLSNLKISVYQCPIKFFLDPRKMF